MPWLVLLGLFCLALAWPQPGHAFFCLLFNKGGGHAPRAGRAPLPPIMAPARRAQHAPPRYRPPPPVYRSRHALPRYRYPTYGYPR